MTKLFLVAALLFATDSFGQATPGSERKPDKQQRSAVTTNSIDTTLRVVHVNKNSHYHDKLPAYYVNGKLVNEKFIYTINPRLIESIKVEKDNLQIDNITYHGQVYIKIKDSYSPMFLSLTELKAKHTNLKSEPTIFMVDGEVVTTDYDKYIVDENQLWRIIIDKVENKKENVNLNFIKLLTKSEENLNKPVKINIRGAELSLAR